ncbi:MAG: hypothetical protein ACOCRX_00290 [Candidatus Woesearchaeota archaeon]
MKFKKSKQKLLEEGRVYDYWVMYGEIPESEEIIEAIEYSFDRKRN